MSAVVVIIGFSLLAGGKIPAAGDGAADFGSWQNTIANGYAPVLPRFQRSFAKGTAKQPVLGRYDTFLHYA